MMGGSKRPRRSTHLKIGRTWDEFCSLVIHRGQYRNRIARFALIVIASELRIPRNMAHDFDQPHRRGANRAARMSGRNRFDFMKGRH